MTKLAHAFAIGFLLVFVAYIVSEVRQKPRILVLNSYDTDYSWVQEVETGIRHVLNGKPYTVRWHYMDTKRHPDESFKVLARRSARNVIDEWRPNILIAIADPAQEVAQHYLDRDDIMIVFGGVIARPEDYGYDRAKNVLGILERWPMSTIREGIEEIFLKGQSRERIRILSASDNSETGLLIAREISEFDWGPQIEVQHAGANTFDEWKAVVERGNSEADLLLVALYHTLKRDERGDEVVPPDEVMQWTRTALQVPSVGGWGFFTEQGGMMSIGVSAYEQGEVAARLADAWIEGDLTEKPSEFAASRQFIVYLREPQLRRFGVQVPSIFEAFARATGNYFVD